MTSSMCYSCERKCEQRNAVRQGHTSDSPFAITTVSVSIVNGGCGDGSLSLFSKFVVKRSANDWCYRLGRTIRRKTDTHTRARTRFLGGRSQADVSRTVCNYLNYSWCKLKILMGCCMGSSQWRWMRYLKEILALLFVSRRLSCWVRNWCEAWGS